MGLTTGNGPFSGNPTAELNFAVEPPTGSALIWWPVPQRIRAVVGDETLVGHVHLETAFGNEMEEHHVLGPGKPLPYACQTVFRLHAPGRGELRVEVDRAFEAHRLENVRQGIHGVSGKKRGVSAKTLSRRARRLAPVTAPDNLRRCNVSRRPRP